jgi:D-threo-aldose 1-dehydrogenase
MDPFLQRRIATTSLRVTQLGFGGASLGDTHEIIPEAQASGSIEAAHAAGIGYFDTSPWYGNGKSELRFGHVLRNKPRDSFVPRKHTPEHRYTEERLPAAPFLHFALGGPGPHAA